MARKPNRSQNNARQSKPAVPSVSATKTPSVVQQPAAAAQPPAVRRPRSLLGRVLNTQVQRALQLVLLAALASPISQLNLSPVYGSESSALYHRYGLTASFLVAFALRGYLPPWVARVIAPFCFWIPSIQFLLFQFSSVLGNSLGPVVTELLTCFPLVVASMYMAIQLFDEDAGSRPGATFGGDAAPSMGLFVLFTVLNRACKGFMAASVGPGFLRSRIGMQLTIASLYAMVLRQSVMWPSLPALAVTMVINPHCSMSRTTEVLNNTLGLYDYTLLERRESITGYLSVLDDHRRQFRVMRCDHSLLGGEWRIPPPKGVDRKVGEPIYSVFVMLEAVRLVEGGEPDHAHTPKTALNIGLGVGTAPAALIAHGVNTTIMELDPAVYEFATKYFSFPTNHTAYIGDAVAAVLGPAANASTVADSYDYILHDVFTGGAEPAELFTLEFLGGLHRLLRPRGVIAINYAGDLALPAASIVYRTVTAVFPSCRVFREEEAPPPPAAAAGPGAAAPRAPDFTNMVFFCRKTDAPVTFRTPVEADFLGSGARRDFLLPKHEILPAQFDREGELLRAGKTRILEEWQAKSALGHWKIMRTVLPHAIWENW